jgi:hypothetical protein
MKSPKNISTIIALIIYSLFFLFFSYSWLARIIESVKFEHNLFPEDGRFNFETLCFLSLIFSIFIIYKSIAKTDFFSNEFYVIKFISNKHLIDVINKNKKLVIYVFLVITLMLIFSEIESDESIREDYSDGIDESLVAYFAIYSSIIVSIIIVIVTKIILSKRDTVKYKSIEKEERFWSKLVFKKNKDISDKVRYTLFENQEVIFDSSDLTTISNYFNKSDDLKIFELDNSFYINNIRYTIWDLRVDLDYRGVLPEPNTGLKTPNIRVIMQLVSESDT